MYKKNNRKKEIIDYIRYYTLSDEAKEIIGSSKIINNEGFDVWSFKKLIFLEYYLGPFLDIWCNNNTKCFFLDTFSSAGANEIPSSQIRSIGSPIISLLKGVKYIKSKNKNNRFSKWFFIDWNKDYCSALEERVKKTLDIINLNTNENLSLNKDVSILSGDCNARVLEVISEIEKEQKENNSKVALLAFIDPYTFTDIKWATFEKLFSLKYVDIIFTLPIQTIQRGYKPCKNLEEYLPKKLHELLKKQEISSISPKEFEKAYAEGLTNLTNRSMTFYDVGIMVRTLQNREIYRINLFTHCSSASKAVLSKAKELDSLKSEDIKTIIEQLFGRQKSIFDFKQ
jgi:three-Cys-motif partner protein